MGADGAGDPGRTYDRDYLLSEEKRNQVMELWEVQKFGHDSFGDPEYQAIYGMTPSEWYGRGVRLLARTTLEAVRDKLGEMIGRDVERVIRGAPDTLKFVVIDPFAGSCNGLYWIVRYVRGARGIGYEADPTIYQLTRRNLGLLDRPIELLHGDYKALLGTHRFPPDHAVVAFLAPPWGDALDRESGLDLRRTKPPIPEIVGDFERVYSGHAILYVVQVHQHLEPASLAEVRAEFDWSEVRIYDINAEGMKHGVLLGTRRWPAEIDQHPPSPCDSDRRSPIARDS